MGNNTSNLRSTQRYYSYCIEILVLLATAIAIVTPFESNVVISILFSCSFIITFGFAFFRIASERYSKTILVSLVVISLLNVLANAMISSDVSFGFNYMKKWIMFMAFIIFLSYSNEYSISNKTYKIIQIVPIVAGLFLIVSYYFGGNTATIAGLITLGFKNPNFTGMWLQHIFFFMLLYIVNFREGSWKRFLLVPFMVVILFLINMTGARSCFIGLIVFAILLTLKRIFKRFKKFWILFIILSPIIFVFVYMSFVQETWFNNYFAFAIGIGKSLTSRVIIWEPAINVIKASPILGDYCGISLGTGVSQLHNTHLDVLCSYGIIPFILFIRVLYKLCMDRNNEANNLYSDTAFCAFLAVLITGTFEAAVVAGATGLNLLTIGLFALSKYENE